MDVNQLLFFEKHESTNLYCTVMNELGQVFYCEADEEKQVHLITVNERFGTKKCPQCDLPITVKK